MTPLRPMSTGEILDRTFSMYRGNFWLFVGISAVPPALMLLVSLAFTGTTFANLATPAAATSKPLMGVAIGSIGVILGTIAYLIGLAIAQGATVYAVSAVHLGHSIGIRESYQRMRGKFGRVVNVILSVMIRVGGAGLLLMLVAISLIVVPSTLLAKREPGGPAGIIMMALLMIVLIAGAAVLTIALFVRYSLAVPACVLEDLKARAAMKRSAFLAKGSRGKILAIYTLVLLLSWAVSFAVLLPIQLLTVAVAVKARVAVQILLQVLNHLASFAVGALIGPLATIALALVYYDERVRKEAFDIQYMMESLGGNAAAPPAPPAPGTTPQIG